jgi:hypothetical protein
MAPQYEPHLIILDGVNYLATITKCTKEPLSKKI